MVSCLSLSLWWFIPQDECIFNTLPYYITDLFIITYRYSEIFEGMTPPDVRIPGPADALSMQRPCHPKPSDLTLYRATLRQLFPSPLTCCSLYLPSFVFLGPDTNYQLGREDQIATLIFFFVVVFFVFFLKVGAQSLAVSM